MRQTNGEPYMYIDDGDIVIRPLTAHDYPLLLQWLTDPRVLTFYGGRDLRYTLQTLKEHYEEPFDGEGFRVIIEYRGTPVGYGQIYEVCGNMSDEYCYPKTDRTVYAMDQFIGETDHWNLGIGTQYCKMVCTCLKEEKHVDAVILDPHKSNARAIRAYQKAGFSVIGELPQHELFEGDFVDCLLMEKTLS